MARSAAEERDLSGFREALTAQHMERSLALKRAVDEQIADMIMARRLEVEGIVHRLRCASKAGLSEGLSANRRHGELRMRSCRAELRNEFVELLENRIAGRLKALRSTREYGKTMEALAEEASEGLSPPFVALVEKGDAAFLRARGDIRELREELRDAWGGLVLIEADKKMGRLVDNTFRTRWRRLYPFFSGFSGKLREHLDAVLSVPLDA
ncbi:MAG: hypothetical protein LBQ90_02290 [Synergistaceae bacterium]|jgi:hypothetical protein|nr:hypothetical protein [Synergistaceae bacterium]